ncbi:hypothetical protein AVP_164 [Aerococcus phage vB_AviM_AVP]|nr:hypothetical protein AVP_164 [Aerococcus phage vB_AviM_AVP]
MRIHEALKAIDNRVNFKTGRLALDLRFYDDYDTEHRINVCLPMNFLDRLTNKQINSYKAFAKQYGDMFIIVIEKGEYNESYTVINNTVIDHEKYNPNHFIEFKQYTMLKQDYFRKI